MKPTKIKIAPSRSTVVKKAKEILPAPKPEHKKPQVVCSEAVFKFETLAMPKGITLLPAPEKFNLEAILRGRKALTKMKPFLEGEEEGLLVPEEELTYQDEYDYDYEEEEGLEEEEELEEMEEEELEEEVDESDEEEAPEEEDEDYRY